MTAECACVSGTSCRTNRVGSVPDPVLPRLLRIPLLVLHVLDLIAENFDHEVLEAAHAVPMCGQCGVR